MPNSRPARNVPMPSERSSQPVEPTLPSAGSILDFGLDCTKQSQFQAAGRSVKGRCPNVRFPSFTLPVSRFTRVLRQTKPISAFWAWKRGSSQKTKPIVRSVPVRAFPTPAEGAHGETPDGVTASRTAPNKPNSSRIGLVPSVPPLRWRLGWKAGQAGRQAHRAMRNVAGKGSKASKSVQKWFDRGRWCAKIWGFYTGTRRDYAYEELSGQEERS